jgi:hypothetical protein
MKALLLAFLVLGPTSVTAKYLVVLADITLLPGSGYAEMPKDLECDKPAKSVDLVVVCVGGWSRYQLRNITCLDGTRMEDTTALIYADPVLGGRWHLALQRLGASAAARFGARFKVVSFTRANEIGARSQ